MKCFWLCCAAVIAVAGCSTVASSSHFTHGTQALERGDYEVAVKELEEAVRLEPRISRYHNNLAVAYFKLNNETKGWFHLRQAVLLDPNNRQASTSFFSYWTFLERGGKVTVGAPEQDVILALGTPDITVKSGSETSLFWGLKRVRIRDARVVLIENWVGKGSPR